MLKPLLQHLGRVALIMLLFSVETFAQKETFTVKGTVRDVQGHAIDFATVTLNNTLGSMTDKKGNFTISGVPKGTYIYKVSFVGYETQSGVFNFLTGTETLHVKLRQSNLALKGVSVTAKQVQMGSKSVIDQDAIRHIQPKSLSDLFQLVPGNLIQNPDLNNLAQAQIREISSGQGGDVNDANAMGTAVVVDGTPLSNDANLQVMGANKYGSRWTTNSSNAANQTTAGGGTDLRTVSAGNIESMEVISGIPGAEYGNLTSGAVIVKTKAGYTPLEIKAQVDEKSKLAFIGKGFELRQGGAVNFSLDYTQSYGDIRRHYLGYDRITANAGYSRQFGRFSLNVKGAFYSNINNTKTDRQMAERDYHYKNTNVGGRLSVNGRYQPKKAFLTSVDYNLSGQLSRTLDSYDNWISNPDGVITNVRVPGVHEAQFKVNAYHSHYKIEGLPINVFAQLTANKYIRINDYNYTTVRLGAEYTYDGNKGDGFTYDEQNPPQYSNAHTLRPRAYKDIPALHTASVFLSDRFTARVGTIGGQLDAGLRLSNLFLNKSKSGGNNGYFVAEPRVNAQISLLNSRNNSFLDDLSLTGGFGLFNKMPTLLYLYPDVAYFDNVSLAKYSGGEQDRLALMTTDIIYKTQNKNLKVAHSQKWEVGLSLKKGPVSGYVTFFHENHRHEYGFFSQLHIQNYNVYDVPATGLRPAYDEATGNVTYIDQDGNTQTAPSTVKTEMFHWGLPSNTSHSRKYGIEYGLDLGEWKALRTSLSINGAWMHIRRTSEVTDYQSIHYTYGYESVTPAGFGTIRDRFNTTFRFVTHIPVIRMIFTTTVQVVWRETEQYTWEANGKKLYYLDTWTDGNQYMFVKPLGIYASDGSYTPWQDSFRDYSTYNVLMPRFMSYYFKKDVINPWALLSFRFTKELGKTAEVSFIANNFTNTRRYHTNKYSLTRTQLYDDMYFGAELKLKF